MSRAPWARNVILLENLEFLISCRTPLLEILQRLGLEGTSMDAFERRMCKWGRYDIISTLKKTDPWAFQKGTANS